MQIQDANNELNNQARITPDELRKCPEYENYTNAQAEKIIDMLMKLVKMTYSHVNKEQE